jgi:hypothetical protein
LWSRTLPPSSAARDAPARLTSVGCWAVVIGLCLALLLAPALWNGYPLIYPDTGGYLMRPLTGTLELGRSALYGAFLLAGAPLAFWPNIILQAGLIVWLIALIVRTIDLPLKPWTTLAVTVVLTLATSLPWFASQLMPDIMFPAGVLALYLLGYGGERLNSLERILLCAVIAFAIAGHMAMLALALGLVVMLWLIARIPAFADLSPRLSFPALAVACGLVVAPLSNALIADEFAFTPGGASFLFGRLVEDGIVTRYLARQCPDAALRLCAYRNDISTGYDDWLWKNGTPFWKLGGWKGYTGEERRIILATLKSDPLAHLTTAIAHSLEQFISFGTEVATDHDDNSHTTDTFRERLPQQYPKLMTARQLTQQFDVSPLNWIDVPIGALSMVGLAGMLLFRRRLGLTPRAAALDATVLLALAVNAVVCGVFSHPADRYQSRLVPLAPLALMVIMASRRPAEP